jgi:hypothetical protein
LKKNISFGRQVVSVSSKDKPSYPNLLLPQPKTELSDIKAKVCLPPHETRIDFLSKEFSNKG